MSVSFFKAAFYTILFFSLVFSANAADCRCIIACYPDSGPCPVCINGQDSDGDGYCDSYIPSTTTPTTPVIPIVTDTPFTDCGCPQGYPQCSGGCIDGFCCMGYDSDHDGKCDVIHQSCGDVFPSPEPTVDVEIDFYGEPISGDSPLMVHFYLKTDPADYSFQHVTWDFGDSHTSSAYNPVHVYNSPGKFTVSVSAIRAENHFEISTFKKYYVTVTGPPSTIPTTVPTTYPPTPTIRPVTPYPTQASPPSTTMMPPEGPAVIIGTLAVGAVLPIAVASTSVKGISNPFLARLHTMFEKFSGQETVSLIGKLTPHRITNYQDTQSLTKLTLSQLELIAASAGALLIGIAFTIEKAGVMNIFQSTGMSFISNILIFTMIAGTIIIFHEFGHRLMAFRKKCHSEYQFWWLGTGIMFITLGLFGITFGSPGRVSIPEFENLTKRDLGHIMMVGPLISLGFAIVFYLILQMSLYSSNIAKIGLSISLLSAVYSLMPLHPMDGEKIVQWHMVLWLVFFIPSLVAYFYFAFSGIL